MKIMFVLLCSAFMVSAYAAQLKDTTFLAKTNVGGVSISGKVGTLNGRLDGFLIPLKKLKTGVSLRDKHMRKKIFKNKPIFFKGGIQCQSECLLKGTLSIANVEKEVSIGLAKKENKYFCIVKNV